MRIKLFTDSVQFVVEKVPNTWQCLHVNSCYFNTHLLRVLKLIDELRDSKTRTEKYIRREV